MLAPKAVMGFGVCRLTRCLLDVSLGFAVAANVGSRNSFTEVANTIRSQISRMGNLFSGILEKARYKVTEAVRDVLVAAHQARIDAGHFTLTGLNPTPPVTLEP